MRSALLVIDAQNAFFEGEDAQNAFFKGGDAQNAVFEGTPVFEAASVLANIRSLLAAARQEKVPVVFVQHCEEEGEFARSTSSWRLHESLGVRADEPVVEKTQPDSFLETGLAEVLERCGARRVVIAGNQTEFCIDTTCRSARSRGYAVTLAADAHGSPQLSASQIIAHHNHVLGIGFAEVVPSAKIAFG